MASPQIAQRLLTAEEFYDLDEPEEGGKMELIDGEVKIDMPVAHEHGELASLLIELLGPFVRSRKLGKLSAEVGFVLRRNPDRVRAPDIAFVSTDDTPPGGIPKHGAVPFPPTLAIEIVSPNDLDSKIAEKVGHYLEAGVKFVWVVRPKTQAVTVHRPDRTARTLIVGETLTSDDAGFAVPGFALPVGAIFAE